MTRYFSQTSGIKMQKTGFCKKMIFLLMIYAGIFRGLGAGYTSGKSLRGLPFY